MSYLDEKLSIKRHSTSPKDLGKARLEFNKNAVQEAYVIMSNWGNPFETRESLVNISSGVEASDEVKRDLIEAELKGESSVQEFSKKRLKSSEVSFYDPIKRLSLKTFSDMKIKKTIKLKEKSVTLAVERSIFGRLLAVAKDREGLSLQKVLSYSLSPIPWCFGLPDGGLVKTVKSKLLGRARTLSLLLYFSVWSECFFGDI